MQFRLLPLALLALLMIGWTMFTVGVPIWGIIVAGVVVILSFVVAFMFANRHRLLFRAPRKWKECREEFAPDGIIKEEEVEMQMSSGFSSVAGRRISGQKRRGRGYLLLTQKWFLAYYEDVPVVYIPHASPDPTCELGVAVYENKLTMEVTRFDSAKLGHLVLTITSKHAGEWFDLLVPDEDETEAEL